MWKSTGSKEILADKYSTVRIPLVECWFGELGMLNFLNKI